MKKTVIDIGVNSISGSISKPGGISANISVPSYFNGKPTWGGVVGDINNQVDLKNKFDSKQDKLVSGESIKTINDQSLLGAGNIQIDTNAEWGSIKGDIRNQSDLNHELTVLKNTVNNVSTTISGYGDIVTHNADEFVVEQDLKDYAKKEDLPTIGEYVTEAELAAKDYADKSYVTDKIIEAATSGTIDMSPYLKKTEASQTYVAKEAGKSLVSDKEIERLASVTNYNDTPLANRVSAVEQSYLSLATVATSGSYDDLSNKPTIPPEITEDTVTDWGFSKTTGTVTYVKMNEDIIGPTDGVIDLGTVVTEKQDISGKQDKITLESKLSADLIADGNTNKTVTAAEKTTWNNKQAAISDLSTIRANATAGANAHTTISGYGDVVTHNASEFQPAGSYANTSHTHTVSQITDLNIPTVNNSTITIQKNSATVDSFTTNAATNKTINITVPTTAKDVSALPDSTKYAASLSLTINSTTYEITATLKDQDGKILGNAQTIDLPLESVVVGGAYDEANKRIVLTLKSGDPVYVPIGDLINGLQSELSATNKLNADYIKDGNTNAVVTKAEKEAWNNAQPSISDIDTIRSNASAGASAATTISGYGDIVTHNASEFRKTSDTISADSIVDGTTNKVVTATEKSTWNNKQASISDLSTIRSNASKGANAASTIAGYGDIVTHNTSEFISSTGTISADKLVDGDTNKVVTGVEKTTWNNKQSAITVNPPSANEILTGLGINGANYALGSSTGNTLFTRDLKTYFTIGQYNGTTTNPVTIPTKGKTIEEVLTLIYTVDIDPVVTQPYISGGQLTNGTAFEVGTNVTPAYKFTFNKGKYEFGPDTGVSVTSWSFSDSNSQTWTNASDTGNATAIQVTDSTNYVISAVANHSSGVAPYNNDHTKTIPSLAIAAGATESYSLPAITGYRNMFIGYTASTSYTSDVIRALNARNSKASSTSISLSENTSAKSIIIAFPSGTQTFSVIMPSSSNADITTQFVKQSAVSVAGANNYSPIAYDVYVYTPARMAGTYKIDLRRV